ncbi:MAG: hypothetical protein QOC71_1, partial [Thermoplasmata archaeon]|nr:hypothetical protein [Thermoplasmata archaeon]
MTALHVRLLPFALACLLTAFALPTQSGTAEAPEVVDAPGDAGLPPLDIAAAWFEATDTDIVVHIERAEGSGTPPPVVACQQGNCAGAGVSLRVVFKVLKPDGTPSPTLADYASSYVLVRMGPDDPTFVAALGFYDSAATGTLLDALNATIDGTSISVVVPRASEAIAMPTGPTPGAYRITEPYALSYAMGCVPSEGCLSQGSPHEATAAGWDRAPDTDFGMDFVFPSPPPPPAPAAAKATGPAATVTSTTTVTVVQKEVKVMTVTETATFTHTPLPLVSDAKGTPGLGL